MNICHYSIVRLVPDPIAGERINIGVVVLTATKVLCASLTKWDRAANFAGDSVTERGREFVENELPSLTETSVKWYTENAEGVIQFSRLLPSLENPNELLDRLRGRYLVTSIPQRQDYPS